MKAMVVTALGGPEVLRQQEMPDPTPGPYDLLIEVHAAATNPVDVKIRASNILAQRTVPFILGYDVSGVVRATGKRVRDFAPGDEVYASPAINRNGSNAELVCVDYRTAARKPRTVDHLQAAALPLVTLTAWESLIDRARIRKGQTVLIHAGAGGVGHIALQLAKNTGCRVLTTASRLESMDLCRSLGADVVIDYSRENVVERVRQETDGQGCDVVYDTVGGPVFSQSQECLANFGRLVAIVPESDAALSPMMFLKNATFHGEFMGLRAMQKLQPQLNGRILHRAAELVDQGTLRPHLGATFDLPQLPDAHRLQESGHATGKIVIRVR